MSSCSNIFSCLARSQPKQNNTEKKLQKKISSNNNSNPLSATTGKVEKLFAKNISSDSNSPIQQSSLKSHVKNTLSNSDQASNSPPPRLKQNASSSPNSSLWLHDTTSYQIPMFHNASSNSKQEEIPSELQDILTQWEIDENQNTNIVDITNTNADFLVNTSNAEDASAKVKECYTSNSDTLDLHSLGLKSFPTSCLRYLPNVRCLNLTNNQISNFSVTEANNNLTFLDLTDNNFESIPDVHNLTSLQSISLSGNVISNNSVNSTQNPFQGLNNLQEVNMSLTGLHTIPLALFSLPRACKVDLTGCALPTNEIEKYINTNDRPQISYSQNRQTNIDALIQTIYQKANKTHAIPDLGLLSQYDQEHGDYVLQWLSQFLTLNITQDEAERVAEIIGNSANATSGEFWREQFSGICKEGIRAVEKTKTLSLQNLGYYKISNQLDAPGNGDY